ncbi:MAG: phospho-N-acetylmuramoyl-pentapeptide-transferase [Omnitrophica WOR_2 bacterium GWF2_43_52]|nr:MAG: phospho-N-acetylmuramoyl-pentapeptide-transferase [Omnitrophica WOR_2 bacterium GWA2_44_7]OGX14411.1 MAG: phospho-N-acetylmuramoyl-pentapeptide-transferase [Omnitrophica WOR_2 bacterium GWC2_44_8]OGX20925.1 MAG: phospho-N-acetylmuramoyl-pentapeptide-transferase [Omnitrophica WOR_2 bacterium GWF2_43_52]OGX54462.1 MAG: phospho-N-acetylmuramoyl-pentapeptide-transferase [Omnitrophica WOR_2 bacterium RIFOXYC2_FULL_43_9]HAH21102.1 phospho-N-acetylmuramoyl-pentapeptide-transferase [Candidatus 
MLFHLLYPLREFHSFFNIFKYITFRAVLAATTAFLISIIFGPWLIRKLAQLKIGQHLRSAEECLDLYQLHSSKAGTPTMGGILILLSIVLSVLLWADLQNRYILLTLVVTLCFSWIGFRDDYIKLTKKRSKGLSITEKFIPQALIGLGVGLFAYYDKNLGPHIDVPFLKESMLNLGLFYIFFVMVVVVGCSNAVNLTDGLDGLAIGSTIMVTLTYTILSYVSGHLVFSKYLLIPFIPGSGELTVFCASILGAGLGFLWFNCFPASVFMGDIGSLALGGAIGTIAVFIKKELLLVVVGGIFVVEALSVILQVGSFRLRKGKRIFKVAPLHHHFQVLGCPESKVIVRFWIVGIILAVLTLATLKIR